MKTRVPSRRRLKPSRAEKTDQTRRALIDAAAKVVGRYGYADASILRITQYANVGQGTFYNYFESRQELLDRLLPMLGREMLIYIRASMDPDARGAEREEQRIRAYFEFLIEHPWFHRLVNEAETLAPAAHEAYFEEVSRGYIRALRRSLERGELRGYEEEDLEPVAYMLMATRTYLAQRYAYDEGRVQRVPEKVFKAYTKFIRSALFDDAGAHAGAEWSVGARSIS